MPTRGHHERAAQSPQRFACILLGNGGLPNGERFSRAFDLWRAFATYGPWFPIGRIVQGGTKRKLRAAEIAAYEAPFPSAAYTAAARVYPSLVPVTSDDPATAANLRAWEVFERWEKPFICCFSDGDPITRGADRQFLERVPGARGQPHATLHGGHSLQEDDPQALARLVIAAAAPRAGRGGSA